MASKNEILTVSYGTFSCTLEGFDDTFGTMTAVTAYFRDLAAEDRYFGAEPPTPDAEMLARIAEAEIARRVEAHDQDGRIHLRAAETPAAETPPVAIPSPVLPTVEDAAPEQPLEDAAQSSAMSPARDMAEPAPAEDVDKTDDAPLEDIAEVMEAPAPAPAPEGESVADKLRRIRAVASPAGDTFTGDSYNEDEHAQDFLSSTAADMEEALAQDEEADRAAATDDVTGDDSDQSILDALAADETPVPDEDAAKPTTPEKDTDDAEDQADEDILAAIAQDSATEAATEEATDMADPSEMIEDDGEEDALTEMLKLDDSEDRSTEDTLAQLMADAMQDDDATEAKAEAEPEPVPVAEPAPETAEQDAADAPTDPGTPLNARVIKMKRSEFEAVLAEADIEDDIDPDAVLSPEDEAELQRELAEVEAELAPLADATPAPTTTADAPAADTETAPAPAPEPSTAEDTPTRQIPQADAAETDRMFQEADTQLDDSEGTERRSAIKHLRAAVGAAKAEKNAGGEIAPETDAAPYRVDLEQAVRPRRPQASGAARSERPAMERPAPLRLVAEQRIDTPSEPVRPRRVARTDIPATPEAAPATDTAGTFADYAESVGADSLPDLLEAAAAYLSDVEGRDQFSRPMLMHKLKEIDADGFSREDGLRSFGHLLRKGKLQKLKGGRFAVTDETDFRQAG